VVPTVRHGSDVPAVVMCTGASISSNSAYTTMSGTSMACPHVTGAIALLMAKEVRPFFLYSNLREGLQGDGCSRLAGSRGRALAGAPEGGEGPCSTA
jgi:subtilisin family serine protease